MYKILKQLLPVQEYDMQMIQLMNLKNERVKELDNLNSTTKKLQHQVLIKEGEVIEVKKNIRILEGEVEEIIDKLKKLEAQQSQVKKVEEFNALNHEVSATERERSAREQRLSDLFDKLALEEDALKTLKETLAGIIDGNQVLHSEIVESVTRINDEGREIKLKRDNLVKDVDPEIFAIYERLLKNKRDRIIVPIENRCCSGCHITLTPQHENLARKGERLVFCEHCSRIHYWQENEVLESDEETTTKKRRRKTTA